jgi:hypothetical protein
MIFTDIVTSTPARPLWCSLLPVYLLLRTPATIVMHTCASSDSHGLNHLLDYLLYVTPFGSFLRHYCFMSVCYPCVLVWSMYLLNDSPPILASRLPVNMLQYNASPKESIGECFALLLFLLV